MLAERRGTLYVLAPGPAVVYALVGLWMLASTAGQSMRISVEQQIAPGDEAA
jgi:hypothetical protein